MRTPSRCRGLPVLHRVCVRVRRPPPRLLRPTPSVRAFALLLPSLEFPSLTGRPFNSVRLTASKMVRRGVVLVGFGSCRHPLWGLVTLLAMMVTFAGPLQCFSKACPRVKALVPRQFQSIGKRRLLALVTSAPKKVSLSNAYEIAELPVHPLGPVGVGELSLVGHVQSLLYSRGPGIGWATCGFRGPS